MSIAGLVKGYWSLYHRARAERQTANSPRKTTVEHANWALSLQDPSAFYAECVRYFYSELPEEFRRHRAYFHNIPTNRRGYGETAFHTMWYLLLEQFRPANFLEIGVFRGQVISLVALWAKLRNVNCDVWGISPFSSAGDSVSRYRKNLDYYEDTLVNFQHFQLPVPGLVRAYSTDPKAVEFMKSKQWDMIYIDGNHDYEVVRQDWKVCSQTIKPGGVVVLDDAGLTTEYQPPVFASKGHPGPSRIAHELDRSQFRELLQVGHNRAFQKRR